MKLLNIWSVGTLLGENVGQVITYLVSRGASWNKYLLNHVRAGVHRRPTPEYVTAVYLLMFSRAFPRSGNVLSFLAPPFFARFLSVFLSPVFHPVSI